MCLNLRDSVVNSFHMLFGENTESSDNSTQFSDAVSYTNQFPLLWISSLLADSIRFFVKAKFSSKLPLIIVNGEVFFFQTNPV